MNALVAYYSWSGNTRKIAELIQKETGGTLFEIQPVQPYSSGYNTCLEEAKKDIKAGCLPELSAWPDNMDGYDTVFVGSPNWWSTLAPPVSAFLTRLHVSGKVVAPFCSHGGGGAGRCISDAAGLCPDASVAEGLVVYGSSVTAAEISRWVAKLEGSITQGTTSGGST